MVDLLDSLLSEIVDKNPFLKRIKYYSILRFIIKAFSNIVIPLIYYLTKTPVLQNVIDSDSVEIPVLVSLTSFPARIHRVWVVIESILRQSMKPDKIILWLSKDDFSSLADLPKSLLKLQNNGLEIILCEGNIKSHKKYYYALKQYPKNILITLDDDIIYPTTIVAQLLNLHKKHPNSICCHRANRISYDYSKFRPYSTWESIRSNGNEPGTTFFTTGGGTLFPPKALPAEALNQKLFKELCMNADDVWLNVMSWLNGTPVVKSNYYSDLLILFYVKNTHLWKHNIEGGDNDRQLGNLRQYYKNVKDIDIVELSKRV